MRIDPSHNVELSRLQSQAAETKSEKVPGKPLAGQSASHAAASSKSDLAKLASRLRAEPDDRVDQLAQAKNALESGELLSHETAAKLADAILAQAEATRQ